MFKTSGMILFIHYSIFGIYEGRRINKIKISVIITSYNHKKCIKKCMDNILMQKAVDFELIVGNDCSTDNTREILEEY
jgi:cellulose synthase/poly-beta-1,6-N-acetylglucosamine synthase-like glycosyltransferase